MFRMTYAFLYLKQKTFIYSSVNMDLSLHLNLRVGVPIRSLNFFNLPNLSSCTMALGLTQPLTEMSTRKCFRWAEHGRCIRLTTSPPSVSQLSTPVVPNGVGTAHWWALKRSKGAFLVQGKFRGRWGPTAAPLGNTRKNALKSLINTKIIEHVFQQIVA
jgi:hypothetical protein